MSQLEPCPECGAMSPVQMTGEESLVSLRDRSIAGVGRGFAPVCELHGVANRQRQKMGHHATLQESQLKKLFTKGDRARLKQVLDPDEWRVFLASLHGKRWPSQEEVTRWKELL